MQPFLAESRIRNCLGNSQLLTFYRFLNTSLPCLFGHVSLFPSTGGLRSALASHYNVCRVT